MRTNRDSTRPLLSAAGCRNVIIVVVVLAMVGAAWTLRADRDAYGASFLIPIVAATSYGILFITLYGLLANARAMFDWFVVRRPPVVEHPVLGTLRYAGMRWRCEPGGVPCGMQGRRRGPDPALVAALAHVVSNLHAFEERGREFAHSAVPTDAPIGSTSWIEAGRNAGTGEVVTYHALALPGGPEDFVRVTFRGDQPMAAERR